MCNCSWLSHCLICREPKRKREDERGRGSEKKVEKDRKRGNEENKQEEIGIILNIEFMKIKWNYTNRG